MIPQAMGCPWLHFVVQPHFFGVQMPTGLIFALAALTGLVLVVLMAAATLVDLPVTLIGSAVELYFSPGSRGVGKSGSRGVGESGNAERGPRSSGNVCVCFHILRFPVEAHLAETCCFDRQGMRIGMTPNKKLPRFGFLYKAIFFGFILSTRKVIPY